MGRKGNVPSSEVPTAVGLMGSFRGGGERGAWTAEGRRHRVHSKDPWFLLLYSVP